MGKLSILCKDDKVLARICHYAPAAWLKMKRTSRLFMWRLDEVKLQQLQYELIEEFHLLFVDVHELCASGSAECLWLLLSQGLSVKLRDAEGATMLQKATHSGQLPILQFLLERGAGVNTKGAYGYTPLHEVCYLGHAHACAFLLERKANYDALSKNGSTPLMVAAREGHTAAVETLLRYGADAEDGGDKPWSPLFVAIGEGHMDVSRVLLSFGASAEGVEAYLQQLHQHHAAQAGGTPQLNHEEAAQQQEIWNMLQVYGQQQQQVAAHALQQPGLTEEQQVALAKAEQQQVALAKELELQQSQVGMSC